jgi:hypothetical protein
MDQTRYAALAQFVELANLGDEMSWPLSDGLGLLPSAQATPRKLNPDLFEAVARSEADHLQREADNFVRDRMEPFWKTAREKLRQGAVVAIHRDRRAYTFNNIRALHETARDVRSILQTIATNPSLPDLFRDFLLPALQEADLKRLRICPVCGQIFLALRSNRRSCSERCSTTNRAKKFRKDHPEYYSSEQREKRRQRSKGSPIPSCGGVNPMSLRFVRQTVSKAGVRRARG